MEQAFPRAEVAESESVRDLRQFLALHEGIKTRRVARRAFRGGGQPGDEAAVVGDGHLIDPPEAGAMLRDNPAGVLQQKKIRVSRRGDRACGDNTSVFTNIQTRDPLPRQLTQSPGIPVRHAALGGRPDFDACLRSAQRRTCRQKQETCHAGQ